MNKDVYIGKKEVQVWRDTRGFHFGCCSCASGFTCFDLLGLDTFTLYSVAVLYIWFSVYVCNRKALVVLSMLFFRLRSGTVFMGHWIHKVTIHNFWSNYKLSRYLHTYKYVKNLEKSTEFHNMLLLKNVANTAL